MPGAGAGCANAGPPRPAAARASRRGTAQKARGPARSARAGVTMDTRGGCRRCLRTWCRRPPPCPGCAPSSAGTRSCPRRARTRRRTRVSPRRPAGWRFASSASGRALLRGVEPELGVGHVELGEIGEVGAAVRRRDHDVGEPLRIVGLARGDHLRPGQRQRPEFGRGLLPRRLVDRVRGDRPRSGRRRRRCRPAARRT